MASIKGSRIKEVKALPFQGKELYYTPECYHAGGNMKQALEAHERVWDRLTDDEKRRVSTRWLSACVGEIVRLKGRPTVEDKEAVFQKYLPKLGTPEFTLSKAKLAEHLKEEAKPVNALPDQPNNLQRVITQFVADRAKKLAKKFPGNREMTVPLIEELLSTGTLSLDPKKKRPKPILAQYRLSLSKMEKKALQSKIYKVQTFKNWGVKIEEYLISRGINDIAEVKANHLDNYQTWRDGHKDLQKDTPISVESMKGEIAFFKALYRYAVGEEIAPSHRLDSIDNIQPTPNETQEDKDKPIPVALILEILADARREYTEYPQATDWQQKVKNAKKDNWLSLVALSISGCRPDELNVWKPNKDWDTILVERGKTDAAERSIPITPTLLKIVKDPDWQWVKGDISRRLNQWIERLDDRIFKKTGKHKYRTGDGNQENVTPYRWRHTVTSILMTLFPENAALISERLGHTWPKFTKKRYTDLGAYLNSNREELREFWHWLNADYFKNPGRIDFKPERNKQKADDVHVKLY